MGLIGRFRLFDAGSVVYFFAVLCESSASFAVRIFRDKAYLAVFEPHRTQRIRKGESSSHSLCAGEVDEAAFRIG
jgi:hypothetical protein